MARRGEARSRRWHAFLDVGLWLLFFALLLPAGFVGYVIGSNQGDDEPAATTARSATELIEPAHAFSAEIADATAHVVEDIAGR